MMPLETQNKKLRERNAVLETENDTLRERIYQLEDSMGVNLDAPVVFSLTKQEAVIFGVLMKNKAVLKDKIMMALYSHLPDTGDVEPKIVDVFVCKLRKKLDKFGIKIETIWGQGFEMPTESKKRAQEIIDQAQAAFLPDEAHA